MGLEALTLQPGPHPREGRSGCGDGKAACGAGPPADRARHRGIRVEDAVAERRRHIYRLLR
jgi:hypothetical protein